MKFYAAPLINRQRVIEFIHTYGDHHITQEAFSYYQDPNSPGILILAYEDEHLVGLSGSKIGEGNVISYSITVVHPEYRNRGIGTKLLRQKMSCLDGEYRSIVAADNVASRRICEKAGLVVTSSACRKRRDGSYEALTLSPKRVHWVLKFLGIHALASLLERSKL